MVFWDPVVSVSPANPPTMVFSVPDVIDPPAEVPMMELLEAADVIMSPEKLPTTVLRAPLFPAPNPTYVFNPPEMSPYPARVPRTVFCTPLTIVFPASAPIIVFCLPFVMLTPAATPAMVLSSAAFVMEFPARLPTTVLRSPFLPVPNPIIVLRFPWLSPSAARPPSMVF